MQSELWFEWILSTSSKLNQIYFLPVKLDDNSHKTYVNEPSSMYNLTIP